MRRVGWVLLLGGCAVTEDNFAQRYGDAICERARACDSDEFYEFYADLADCRDDQTQKMSDLLERDCAFVEDEARDCLRNIRNADCADGDLGDIEECALVLDCEN